MSTPLVKRPTSYSEWRAFRSCKRLFRHRYVDLLVPREISEDDPRAIGGRVHLGLELHYRGAPPAAVLAAIDERYQLRHVDTRARGAWHLSRAIFRAYVERYPTEPWAVMDTERRFHVEIVNPATGYRSRNFTLPGTVDLLVHATEPADVWGQRLEPGIWIVEHKTTSLIDSAYLERLWMDFQIHLYADAVARDLKATVQGTIYNVIAKARLKQTLPETPDAFEQRKQLTAEAAERGELGRRLRQKKDEDERAFLERRVLAGREEAAAITIETGETDDAFAARLADWYTKPEAFARQIIPIDPKRLDLLREELWDLTQERLRVEDRNVWPLNTDHCYAFHRPCDYLALCRSGDSPIVREQSFEQIGARYAPLNGAPPGDMPGITAEETGASDF